MGKTPNAMLGDFDQARMEELAQLLRGAGFLVTACRDGVEVLERAQQTPPDLTVLEVFLPRKNGFEVLKALKEDGSTSTSRVLVLIDESDDYGEHRARLCGADAILRRPFPLERVVELAKSLAAWAAPSEGAGPASTPLEEVLDALDARSKVENPLLQHITDPLTGLLNRPYMDLKLAEEYKKARRFNLPLTCMIVALDGPQTSAKKGHPEELRRILNEIAGLLLCESRDIDHLSRYGLQEFLILLPHTDVSGARAMASRILAAVADRGFHLGEGTTPLTASAGVAGFEGPELETAEELCARARDALAASRRWGGNRLTIWSGDTQATSH